MSYYLARDIGFARGDPGFFSFVKGLAAKGAGMMGHMPGAGGIAGKIAGKVLGAGRHGLEVVKRHPVMSAAGGAALGAAALGGGAAMRHPRRVGALPGLPGLRHHRRMRVTNPKALRRAIRRTQGFAKLAMRTIHLVHPRKRARFGGFRKRRKKVA